MSAVYGFSIKNYSFAINEFNFSLRYVSCFSILHRAKTKYVLKKFHQMTQILNKWNFCQFDHYYLLLDLEQTLFTLNWFLKNTLKRPLVMLSTDSWWVLISHALGLSLSVPSELSLEHKTKGLRILKASLTISWMILSGGRLCFCLHKIDLKFLWDAISTNFSICSETENLNETKMRKKKFAKKKISTRFFRRYNFGWSTWIKKSIMSFQNSQQCHFPIFNKLISSSKFWDDYSINRRAQLEKTKEWLNLSMKTQLTWKDSILMMWQKRTSSHATMGFEHRKKTYSKSNWILKFNYYQKMELNLPESVWLRFG